MKVSSPFSRRRFVSAAGAAFSAPFIFPGLSRGLSPNSKVQHACIGVGGMMGRNDFENFKSHSRTEVVAICDVDKGHLEAVLKDNPGLRTYTDWRELLEKEGDRIDSVNVTVPDHMHAIIAMAAIARKKHVYCQKPMCHDVAEVRALRLAAEKQGVITQLGTQHASGFGDRTGVQWMKDGVMGKVKRVILCSNRPGAETYRLAGPRPAEGDPLPNTLNWDLWLGTAPERPFKNGIYHPSMWRSWQDFGTGWSGDIGCHIFDSVWKGLGLTAPLSVVAEVNKDWQDDKTRRAETWSQSNHITWKFPASDRTQGDLSVEWFDGAIFPPDDVRNHAELRKQFPSGYPGEGAFVEGTEGVVFVHHTNQAYLFGDKVRGAARPKLEPRNHYHHFLDTILGTGKCESHFTQTGPMTEAILLGTVAIREPGKLLQWDPAGLKFPNAPEADRLLRRNYRKGWEAPAV